MTEDSINISRLEDHDNLTRLITTVESGFTNLNEKFDNFKQEVKEEISTINSRCPSKLCQIHTDEIIEVTKDLSDKNLKIQALETEVEALKLSKVRQWEAICIFVPVAVGFFTWLIDFVM